MRNYNPAMDGIPRIMPGTQNPVPPFEPAVIPNAVLPEHKSRKEIVKALPKRTRKKVLTRGKRPEKISITKNGAESRIEVLLFYKIRLFY